MTIAAAPSIATRPHRVLLEIAGQPVPDPEGGYTQGWTALDPPAIFVSIRAASTSDLEQFAGSPQASAVHIVEGPFHPGVTAEVRLRFVDHGKERIFLVKSVQSIDERDQSMVLLCGEVLP